MGKSIKQGLKRFLFLAIAWLLAGLAVIIYGVQSDLVNFFLPTRFIVLFCLLAGAAMLVLHILLNVASSRKKWIFAVIMAALIVLSIFVYIREFRAYREIELSFQNEGTELAGTLYLPRQPSKYAAIVIAQGSIRAPRRLYHFWADQLVRDGYAVFSFDKRGTGASGGEYESENNSSSKNLHLLASDVAAAVNAARHHPEIDGEHVGIFGLSMGGWLGPLAAQRLGQLPGRDLAPRHQDITVHPATRPVCSGAGTRIPRAGAHHGLGASFHRLGDRHDHPAVLERTGRVAHLKLEPQFVQSTEAFEGSRTHQRRVAFPKRQGGRCCRHR